MVCVDLNEIIGGDVALEEALALVREDTRTAGAWATDYISAHGMSRAEVIRMSRLNQTFGYQILSDMRNPSRDKLIQLAFGMGLDAAGCSELLERGGVNALTPRSRRDVVIAYCLERTTGVAACDDVLWGLGEQTLVPEDPRHVSKKGILPS